jgi:peroxiredoxin
MIGKTENIQVVRFLMVSLIAISLITACSVGTDDLSQSQDTTKGALTSSSRFSSEIARSAEPADSNNTLDPIQNAGVEQAVPLTTENMPASPVLQPTDVLAPLSEPSTTGRLEIQPAAPAELSPSTSQELQILPQPAVDLSIPVEPRIGFRAPDFSLQTLDGQPYQLSQLLGRPVLINYWTTWCVPCKQELPILEKLHREYQQKGIVFISVNAIDQDSVDKLQAMVSELGISFPVLLDQNRAFADVYQAIFFPTTFIVDSNGVIRQVSLGDNTEEELRTSLDNLLAGLL